MQVRPLSAEFVAEVDGIDRYDVLVFRDQPRDDEQQIAFSSLYGPLETTRRSRSAGRHAPAEPACLRRLGPGRAEPHSADG